MQLSLLLLKKRDYKFHNCWDKKNDVHTSQAKEKVINMSLSKDWSKISKRYIYFQVGFRIEVEPFPITWITVEEEETQPVHPKVIALRLKSPVCLLFAFILLRKMLQLLTAAEDMKRIHLKNKAVI